MTRCNAAASFWGGLPLVAGADRPVRRIQHLLSMGGLTSWQQTTARFLTASILRIWRKGFCAEIQNIVDNIMASPAANIPTLAHRSVLPWPNHGGCSFPFLPVPDAWSHPAIWRASEVPSIIVFQPCSKNSRDRRFDGLQNGLEKVTELCDGAGNHLVLQGPGGRYRILLRPPCNGKDEGYVVEPDEWLAARIAAIAAFHRSSVPVTGSKWQRPFTPTPYQRHRMGILLQILDCMGLPSPQTVTTRHIAEQVVYPQAELGRTIEWKSSSERRHTQRLVAEARYMMETGYRHLLKGRFGKMPPQA